MTNFYKRLVSLCEAKNTTITAVLKDLGISTSKGTAWKTGTIPNGSTLDTLATYFSVTTDYLLGRTQSPNVEYIPADPEKAAAEQAIMEKQRMDNYREMHKALGQIVGGQDAVNAQSMKPGLDISDLAPEDQARAEAYIQALRDKNRK